MTDPRKRVDRWKAKYDLKRVNEALTDLREDMAARCVPRGGITKTIGAARCHLTGSDSSRYCNLQTDSRQLTPQCVSLTLATSLVLHRSALNRPFCTLASSFSLLASAGVPHLDSWLLACDLLCILACGFWPLISP